MYVEETKEKQKIEKRGEKMDESYKGDEIVCLENNFEDKNNGIKIESSSSHIHCSRFTTLSSKDANRGVSRSENCC